MTFDSPTSVKRTVQSRVQYSLSVLQDHSRQVLNIINTHAETNKQAEIIVRLNKCSDIWLMVSETIKHVMVKSDFNQANQDKAEPPKNDASCMIELYKHMSLVAQ